MKTVWLKPATRELLRLAKNKLIHQNPHNKKPIYLDDVIHTALQKYLEE